MKNKTRLLIVLVLIGSKAWTQATTMYFSQQTGQGSSYSGSYSKATDRYENGNFTVSVNGPINYSLDPNQFSIAPNENKTWNGTVQVDASTAPQAGTQSAATLSINYQIGYSRPYGTGTSGDVTSTYYCSDNGSASGNGGCTHHNNTPGAHEIVTESGTHPLEFNVVSILVSVPDEICLGPTGEKDITANAFPLNVGNFTWSSNNPNVQITNSASQTAHIKLLDTNVHNAIVKVRYEINGITYEDQGTLSTCECNCKPINGTVSAGPLSFNVNANPVNQGVDGTGNCSYQSNNTGLTFTMEGVISRTVNIQNNVNLSFKKHCENGSISEVSADWTGEVVVPAISIRGVETFELKVKQIALTVNQAGNLNGTVTINVSNPQDRDLSLGKQFVLLRKGTNSDITFTFSGGTDFTGNFNFSGIQGIVIDLCKQNDGAEVKLASYTGNLDADGLLAGDFVMNGTPSYKTNAFKVQLKALSLGTEIKVSDGSFKLTAGSGTVSISEMKALTGTIDLSLTFQDGGGCNAQLGATDIKAFTMTLDEFNLNADFNQDFDLTKVEGSLKAKHNSFDAKVNVDQFKIENGALVTFNCGGMIKYSSFKFTLENASFTSGPPGKLSITAKVEISATGTAAMIAVDKFEIDEAGSITIGQISGNLNRAPASISFTATFGTNKFSGNFNGDFAAIGMDGTLDIGTEGAGNNAYNYAYLAITVKANVPLGNSGLKLTQIGGKAGYNYTLQGVDGPGNPLQGNYLVGLKLGVADVGNMCEVTGESMVQFGNGSVSITLAGTVAVLKNNKFFDGNCNVTYKIPDQTIQGSVGANIKIPGSGFIFTSNNLNVNFSFGNNQFSANGANMGGSMFGGKIQLSNGAIGLSGNLNSLQSLSGNLSGNASCGFGYSLGVSAGGNSITGSINFNMNSNINMGFNQDGINGTFGINATGTGTLNFDTWVYSTTLQGSAEANGDVGYNNGSLSLGANVTVTLPISIPFWGNQFSTGYVSISI